MRYQKLSPRQNLAMTWWNRPGFGDYDGIICDGSIRSGKTVAMTVGFIMWAMCRFQGQNFALCGKTIESLRRNVTTNLPTWLAGVFSFKEHRTENKIVVSAAGRSNNFYLFGGRDESSASLIQGITLAGVLLDEVALMPRSFVEQACARCSVEGSRLWFNCNPEGPEHWFYKEWIQKKEEHNALYLHFTMQDNPALSPRVIRRYTRNFSGTFYRRFVLGEWAAAEGRVYDFFDESYVKPVPQGEMEQWCISCDYGTVNPSSFGLWGLRDGVWYRVKEFYYDSRREGRQKTDGEYARDLEQLAGGRTIRRVVIDPSAASFIELLRRQGWRVEKANNDVLAGIRVTADLLRQGKLVICTPCADAIREFSLYCWDEKAVGDRVQKVHDHAMDDIRYFAASVAAGGEGGFFGGLCVERERF